MEKYFRVAKNISRWKIEGYLESFLASKADNSSFWKYLYVKYYQILDSEYYNKSLDLIAVEIERQSKNFVNFSQISKSWLIKDMIYSLHRFGVSFEEYFIYRFYNLNFHGRSKFNSLKLQYGYCEQFNSPNIANICEDKSKTYSYLKEYYKRDVLLIDERTKQTDVNQFVKHHKKFIFKPLFGHSGQGIKIFDEADIDNGFVDEKLSLFGPFIIEEIINQAQEMAVLHSQSINTVRIATLNMNGLVYIYGGAVRIGIGNSNIDNAGAGGIYVSIDTNIGVIVSKAMDNKSNRYVLHPDSKVILPGFKLPMWDEAIKLIKKLATTIPGANLLAWDLAYSKDGWCLVEANDIGEQYLLQAPEQQGVKPQLIKMFDQIDIKYN